MKCELCLTTGTDEGSTSPTIPHQPEVSIKQCLEYHKSAQFEGSRIYPSSLNRIKAQLPISDQALKCRSFYHLSLRDERPVNGEGLKVVSDHRSR
ncbi:hypothetical protein CEXT_217771 [Caerostris extrusa]|uniref:Uncharacterized protein n=1 Tax=Caerostris extrusa TaxID=172846 RepID=A0AAV4TY27_CAEEX|nr:hypothetical protein CEXT_217771 [Caerostris extrusa]